VFTSLKDFINSRLGSGMVIKDHSSYYGYFILIYEKHLHHVLFFLKNDPDLMLTLLDQIVALPSTCSLFDDDERAPKVEVRLLYQLKSVKLPYRVTIVIDVDPINTAIPSITAIFKGARWQEEDISKQFEVTFVESYRS